MPTLTGTDRRRLATGTMTLGELHALVNIFGIGYVEAAPEGDALWRVRLDSGLACGTGRTIGEALSDALTDWIATMERS